MLKIRQFLASVLEYCGWALIGPSVISGLYQVSKVISSYHTALYIAGVVSVVILLLVTVEADDENGPNSEMFAFSWGFLIWVFATSYFMSETSISISMTTLLVAFIVYGAIFANWLFTPPTPEQYNE